MMLDEHEDEKNQIKSPIKRYGSTRKVYMFNSEYKRFRVPKLLASDSSLCERDDRTRGNDLAALCGRREYVLSPECAQCQKCITGDPRGRRKLVADESPPRAGLGSVKNVRTKRESKSIEFCSLPEIGKHHHERVINSRGGG